MKPATPNPSALVVPESDAVEFDAVLGWLATLGVEVTATPIETLPNSSAFPCGGARSGRLTPAADLTILTKGSTDSPRTPQRRVSSEISPTKTDFTTFSSVFDSPTRGARDGSVSEISSVGSIGGDSEIERDEHVSGKECEVQTNQLQPTKRPVADSLVDAKSVDYYERPRSPWSSMGDAHDQQLLPSELLSSDFPDPVCRDTALSSYPRKRGLRAAGLEGANA